MRQGGFAVAVCSVCSSKIPLSLCIVRPSGHTRALSLSLSISIYIENISTHRRNVFYNIAAAWMQQATTKLFTI